MDSKHTGSESTNSPQRPDKPQSVEGADETLDQPSDGSLGLSAMLREREELQRKANYLQTINEFAVSLMSVSSLDDILWDVARNAIGKLGFTDCVIYMVDESGRFLHQKAAHGPKNPRAKDIHDPIVIPVGKGIVGSVAASGQPEMVIDTRLDPRYIKDDAMRRSELAVPISHEGKVIGVVDSEHHDKGFYTDEHLEIMITIASMASAKIDTAIAIDRLQDTVERLTITDKRLGKTVHDLRRARDEAEKASSAKSEFLANMSHEIRTPMTAIVGYADLLTRSVVAVEQRREWASQLRLNADHLLCLVNDVLDLSKIEAGEMRVQIEKCSLYELIHEVVALMRPRAVEKGLAFRVEVSSPVSQVVETDAMRFRQILVNLLSNAVKYTDKGEIVLRIAGRNDPASGRYVLSVSVVDTGIGISQSVIGRLFLPFSQASYTRQSNSVGTGLGLVISRSFAKLLGGDITVRSKVHQGSEFDLCVDAGPADSATLMDPASVTCFSSSPARVPTPVTSRLMGYRIHIVDDSSHLVDLIEFMLDDAGAEVSSSCNGAIGVTEVLRARADGEPYDVIIMDMMMPVMDGYAAATALRQGGVTQPIVALTAHSMSDDREKCDAAGCDHYIMKPINPATFVAEIEEIIRAGS